jgi:hypothetical protein
VENNSPITLDVQLRPGDLYWIYFMQAARAGWFVRGYMALALIILVALAPEHLGFLILFVLPPSILVIVGLIFYFLLLRPYVKARAFVRHGETPSPIRYNFSQTGIDVNDAHSQAHHDWAAVSTAKQTANLFVLYLSGPSSLVLPKRCFTSAEEIASFQDLVKSKVIRNRPVHTRK